MICKFGGLMSVSIGEKCSEKNQTSVVESLEQRTLLSASLVKGILSVTGTAGNDAIVLHRTRTAIVVDINGSAKSFKAKAVKSIRVLAGNGDDQVNVDQSGQIFKTGLTISGGAGNDTITGGSGGDVVTGGAGDDSLSGMGGNDLIYGDAGNDHLEGGAGNDVLGGDDEDILQLSATSPASVIGNDFLDGGDGNDWLLGSHASDMISDDNGADTFVGGNGIDVIDGRDSNDSGPDLAPEDIVPAFVPAPDPNGVHSDYNLTVFIKSGRRYRKMFIPTGVGIFNNQMADGHTHDSSGRIHDEGLLQSSYRLADFFRNLGVSLDSHHIGRYVADTNHKLTMTVNGVSNKLFGNYAPRTDDQIVIRYG